MRMWNTPQLGIGVLNFTPSPDASRYLQSQRLSYSSIVSLPSVSSAIDSSTLYLKQYCPEMCSRFLQQSLISFSSAFVSSAAERIDLAIAPNSPAALKISICGCFSDILVILFSPTKLEIFSQVSPVVTNKIKCPTRRLGKIPKNSEMSEGQKSGRLFCVSLQSPNALIVADVSSFPGGRWQFSLFAYPLPFGECEPSSVWRCTFAWHHTSRHTLWVSDYPNRPFPIEYQGAVGGNNTLPSGPICRCNNYVLPICFRASTQRRSVASEQLPPTPLRHWI